MEEGGPPPRHQQKSTPLPFWTLQPALGPPTPTPGAAPGKASFPDSASCPFTLRLCSQQEILEEVVRELHKVKEEIIDGECGAHPGVSPRVLGERQGGLAPRAARQQSGGGPARETLLGPEATVPRHPHSLVKQTEARLSEGG